MALPLAVLSEKVLLRADGLLGQNTSVPIMADSDDVVGARLVGGGGRGWDGGKKCVLWICCRDDERPWDVGVAPGCCRGVRGVSWTGVVGGAGIRGSGTGSLEDRTS